MRFEEEHFSQQFQKQSSVQERRALLQQLHDLAQQVDGAFLEVQAEGYVLTLLTPSGEHQVRFTLETMAPFKLLSLQLDLSVTVEPILQINEENLASLLDDYERRGFSGVVHVRKNGRVLLQRCYGVANEVLNYSIHNNTVFGIGSTPIMVQTVGFTWHMLIMVLKMSFF